MRRMMKAGVAVAAGAMLVLAGCSGDGGGSEGDGGPVELQLAGWSLSTTPEFQLLVDGFAEQNPDITITMLEYDATNYDTQLTADLAAGSAPDLYPLKTVTTFPTYQEGGQLLDVSDVAEGLPEGVNGLDSYVAEDGNTYAIPYRQDAWFLYYNKELFDEAGVDYPDGSWTWDDYADAALTLADELDADGTYQHNWASAVQGFANAQAGSDEDYLSANWDYMVEYYDRVLELQDAGAQASYGTVTTNSLSYQGQFGTQQAAMMPMGSWYVATLLAQRESGDAETFEWGFAPMPQLDSSTVDAPITEGNPTAIGINPAIDDSKVDAAKEFLAYIGSEDASSALAEIGIMPANTSDAVADVMFALDGVPTDDLARFAFTSQTPVTEAPVDSGTPALQSILDDAHSEIMSGSVSAADGIANAIQRAQSEVLG
ncbi:ABC transporter substrate-binding protein [Pseudactinotalea sp.]|uniref:ABC transporter substrate-binding protein n=1 Tax=Pseudactinotalea sp. TaxID=1926260 RepID=UPI003B3A7199